MPYQWLHTISTHGPDRGLTVSQHAAIRLQLALLPFYAWLGYGWWTFLTLFPLAPANVDTARDFAHFYAQGVIARTGDGTALYERGAHLEVLATAISGGQGLDYPPVYGPQVALLFSPLASTSYGSALYLWMALTLATGAACGFALWRSSAQLRRRPWLALVVFGASPAVIFNLRFGQASAVGLVCVTVAYLALRAERRFVAGLAIGALAYKPQLGLAMACVLLAAREWRLVSGAVAAVATQFAIAVLCFGPRVLTAYVAALGDLPVVAAEMERYPMQMHSLSTSLALVGLNGPIARIILGSLIAATIAAALACWRSTADLRLRYSALLIATVLASPHLYVYDLLLVSPALLLLWDWSFEAIHASGVAEPCHGSGVSQRWCGTASFRVLLSACYFSPLLSGLALTTNIQPSVVLHAGLLGLLTICAITLHPASLPARARPCTATPVRP